MPATISVAILAGFGVFVILLLPIDIFRRRIDVQIPDERVDERDTMFARMARTPATPPCDDYYARHPELKEIDDKLRRLPALLEPGGLYYDEQITTEAETYFDAIEGIAIEKDLVSKYVTRLNAVENLTEEVRRMVLDLGAVAVGFTALEREDLYTTKGRFDAEYGRDVVCDHPFAVVFLVEMDYQEMQYAPRAETLRESARQYHRAARIAKTVEAVLVASGYGAKAHYDAHYDALLPPLAIRAGLGELGRNNILIAHRYGSRVRIGAVTTELAVTPTKRRWLGVEEFCRICKKCAENCPSRARRTGEMVTVRGVRKWPTDVERCYGYWRKAGTDCGICMAICPFSHRNNWFHNLVRSLIRLNPLMRRLAHGFDDVIYGRRWNPNGNTFRISVPAWWVSKAGENHNMIETSELETNEDDT